jgi:pyruvate dehydrogenase E1 component alpha subunit
MLWKLPVVFICENNNYAMGTSIERTSNVIDIYKLADAYEMPSDKIDGMTAEAVHEGVTRAVKRARDGEGPTLLEMKTYRYRGHSVSDPQKYRSKDEVEDYKNQDPITKVHSTILENKFATELELQAIDDKIALIVEASVKFAEESPWPDESELLKDVYIDSSYPFIVD